MRSSIISKAQHTNSENRGCLHGVPSNQRGLVITTIMKLRLEHQFAGDDVALDGVYRVVRIADAEFSRLKPSVDLLLA